MAEPRLLDELATEVGSAREARWIIEAASTTCTPDELPDAARAMAARRIAGEPLQYVLGTWQFRTLELEVDPRVLIPRPETEQVVEQALRRWHEDRPGGERPVVVDLGCGSGAMGLSIATELASVGVDARLVLTDRSDDALVVAGRNAERVGLRPELRHGSWYDALGADELGGVHLLVSNPPYVAFAEASALAPELSYEPPGALFSDDDGVPGFADVAAVIRGAPGWLAPGGVLAVEMAPAQVDEAKHVASAVGLQEVEIVDDLAGRRRAVIGVRT